MSKHVNNQAAIDKPLKKINELIHNGSNKKAVQEVDRLPKDIRNQTVFKALKALALINMYKRKQAFDILNEINLQDELDAATLETMTICYKQSVDVNKIVDLFEAASKRKPNDERIVEELFMAHVRAFNFRRQKEIALQMYKNFSLQKRLHSFWAVMSLVMQSQEASSSPDAPDRKVCLSLAEKMCERMMDDERNTEEIELYLTILRMQNKHEEEYKFLTGPNCLRIHDPLSWFTRRRAYLCLDLKMYSRAFKHYFPTLIQDYPDQIEYYQGLLKSAFLLDSEAPSQQQPVVIGDQQTQTTTQTNLGTPVKSASALAECFDIIERQCSITTESLDQTNKDQSRVKSSKNLSRTSSLNPNRRHFLRGPFMARIELYHLITSNENMLPAGVINLCKSQFESKFPDLNTLLLDYFQSISKKIICFYDLDHMIKAYNLTKGDQERLLVSIDSWIKGVEQCQLDIPAYDLFHIKLNRHMLNHLLTDFEALNTRESRLELAKKFIDLYDENRHFGHDSNDKEFLPVDHYCLLAINSLMTNAVKRDSMTNQTILSHSILITLIVLAETACSNSPTNHQLKLTLLKLYSFVGASKQCSKILSSLDIKHFQIDTLGHLLNPVLYNTGNHSLANQSLETCLDSYNSIFRECFESLTNSYCHGKFSRIGEISRVFERLRDSLNASQCFLLKGIVSHSSASNLEELITASHSFDAHRSLHRMFRCSEGTDMIKDNRDFKVLRSLHAETEQLVQVRKLESLHDEKLWLKLRYYIIRSVYIQLDYFGNQRADSKLHKEQAEELLHGKKILTELTPLIDAAMELANSSESDKRYSYFEPESSPFRWKHIQFQSLIKLVNPLVFTSDISTINSTLQETYNAHLDTIINDLTNQMASVGSLVAMKQALLSLTMAVEFISLAITSLVSMTHIGFSSSSNNTSTSNQINSASATTTSASVAAAASNKLMTGKNKSSIPHQMLSKTESQLVKLSNSIKTVDPKILVVNKEGGKLEECLLSNHNQISSKTKGGVTLFPLLGVAGANKVCEIVEENLLASYMDSLKELETICRNKIKLLR